MTTLDENDRKLLERLQSAFPVTRDPYKKLSRDLLIGEDLILDRVRRLVEEGFIRRIGPVFDSEKIGRATTLCALICPEDRIDEVSQVVNAYENVSHNYVRNDASGRVPQTMWFTVGASSKKELARIVGEISRKISIDIARLDAKRVYKLDVKFNIAQDL